MKRWIGLGIGLSLMVAFCEKDPPCGPFDSLTATDSLVAQITLNWAPPCPEAYDYDVYRSQSRKGPWTYLCTICEQDFGTWPNVTELHWTDQIFFQQLPPMDAITYYYKVFAKPYIDTEWDKLSSNIVKGIAFAPKQ